MLFFCVRIYKFVANSILMRGKVTMNSGHDLIVENLKDRDKERLVNFLINNEIVVKETQTLILKSSSDMGAIRNGGRRGTNFGPNAIIASLSKLAAHETTSWQTIELCGPEFLALEQNDFEQSQKASTEKICELIRSAKKLQVKNLIHIGGGHDHVYPLLSALSLVNTYKKLTVINIDSHLDTRTDLFYNSGTPFRQFSLDFEGDFRLIQLGINVFANTKSTMTPLKHGKEIVATYDDICQLTHHFQDNFKFFNRSIPYDPESLYVISLDADALSSSLLEGVSAVNHRGLPYHFVEDLFKYAKETLNAHIFGIYEYNPIFDNLSQKGARALAALLYPIVDSY